MNLSQKRIQNRDIPESVMRAAMSAFGDTEIVGGPPSFTERAVANAVRAALEALRSALLGEAAELVRKLRADAAVWGTEQASLYAPAADMIEALAQNIGGPSQ